MVLSADVTTYKPRDRVSLSLAPALTGVGAKEVACSFTPGQNDWVKAAKSAEESKPFRVTVFITPIFT